MEKSAPVPVNATVCGLPDASSLIVSVPVIVPDAFGVNVTLIVQLALAATEVPQLLVSAKLVLTAIPVIFKVESPGLDRVTLCAALVELTAWSPKVRWEGENVASGPVGTLVTVNGDPGADAYET